MTESKIIESFQQQISALPPIREILEKFNIITKKQLGQNFIFDLNITSKIVRLAGDIENKLIIEIGAGAGSLTRPILMGNPKKLVVIEYDKTVLPAIEQLQNITPKLLEIINADALRVNYKELVSNHNSTSAKIIANLPYNVATELLFNWLESPEIFDGFTLMFQKEVAERITAKPQTKDYSWLAIKAQIYYDAQIEYVLPPTAFFPPPKVDSAVVCMVKRATPLYGIGNNIDIKTLEKVCKAAFTQRRKTIRNNLKNLIQNFDAICEKINLNPQTRPEDISIKTYCEITNLAEFSSFDKA
jgi:16S rRNA (adenine1518-N6/adenine1519-N6)-dimethyltransferase